MKKIHSLDDYRTKLLDKILNASSFEQIKRYLLTATTSLEKHKINGHLVDRFIDKTLDELNKLNAGDAAEAKHIPNVRYAKLQLEAFKANWHNKSANHVSA